MKVEKRRQVKELRFFRGCDIKLITTTVALLYHLHTMFISGIKRFVM